MKLLLISNIFPNPQEPLRGIFIYNIAKELMKKCELNVISPLPWVPNIFKKVHKYRQFACIPKEFEVGGIKVYSPRYLAIPKIGLTHVFFIFFAILPLLLKLNKEKRISVINTHCVFPDGVAVSWIACLLKIPHVLTALGTDINLYSTFRLRRPLIINAMRLAHKVTVVSQAQKELVENLGIEQEKCCVIINGVELGRFDVKDKKDCRDKLGLKADSKIILFVGRIIPIKGVNYLITAVERLKLLMKKNYILLIVGAGELRTEYEKVILDRNLEDVISFVGEKSREELPFWYGACDLFCLPSLMEGCPNVILEAMASGRPIVASRVGGIPEIINNNGMLFEVGNTEQLAQTLAKVMETNWNAREIRASLNGCSWENVSEKYLRVCYESSLKLGDK